MCLIAFAWRAHPRYELALVANRDEFHARPAAPAAFDPERPDVYGGRDLQAGGSWLQVSARGRLAAVTNVRTGLRNAAAPRSRGALVHDFVRGVGPAGDFVASLAAGAAGHGPFNLLAWDGDALAFASNHPRATHHPVEPGLHAMSNGAFDAPWPKSGQATAALARWLDSPASAGTPDAAAVASLFDALADPSPAPDTALPETGVGLALERALSPVFVRGVAYGTRCSSIVLVAAAAITFIERRYRSDASIDGESAASLPRACPRGAGSHHAVP
jgi:uncharacterized protein with NRDE domain